LAVELLKINFTFRNCGPNADFLEVATPGSGQKLDEINVNEQTEDDVGEQKLDRRNI
jgi:hypothetical protein